MSERVHELKVVPPYFEALVNGEKTFEVRKNDRAYQRDDVLRLREFGSHRDGLVCKACDAMQGPCNGCHEDDLAKHYSDREVERRVSFVFAGDPRFGGLEQGYVVLALEAS